VRIGVVLSAGGLRGAAHAGVLRQLVRHGVPLHAIVGVSAGAIVAAYYAAAWRGGAARKPPRALCGFDLGSELPAPCGPREGLVATVRDGEAAGENPGR
jgi:Patatin-like phospholipase